MPIDPRIIAKARRVITEKTRALQEKKQFTDSDVANKELVLQMLQFEDSVIKGPIGRSIYEKTTNRFSTSKPEKKINMLVLSKFGFDTSKLSVRTYRTIFKHYYRSPTDFDVDIINAVVYFRENRRNFYTSPKLNINDLLPDLACYTIDETLTTIRELAGTFTKLIVAGFSMS